MKPLRTSDRAPVFGAALAAVTLLVAGCTSTSADSPTTGATAASVLSTSQSSASSSAVPSTPTTSQIETSLSVPSSSAPLTSQGLTSWPATFTADQAADAEAALAVYREAVRLSDEVYQNPGQPDVEAAVSSAITDPWSRELAKAAAQLVTAGRHASGYRTIVSAQVVSIEGTRVSIESCLDSSGVDLLNADGVSVRRDNPVGTRVRSTANVYLYPNPDRWLLSEVTTPQPYQPC